MRFGAALCIVISAAMAAAEEPRLSQNSPSPAVAPDPDFQFRKAKIYTLDREAPTVKQTKSNNPNDVNKKDKAAARSKATTQEASLNFERSYRLFGAVTGVDQRQRFGQYFDFFWRAKRPADVTVRFEYKQEKLRAYTQTKELAYRNAHGTNLSEFRVIGDEYLDDGKVLAWRCLLIEHGRIVAEKRSFLWD
jgi:hypothetical protein